MGLVFGKMFIFIFIFVSYSEQYDTKFTFEIF